MRRVSAVLIVLFGTLAMGLFAAPVATSVAGAAAPSTVMYDSTDPSAATLVSAPYEATGSTEIGGQIQFAPGTSRLLHSLTVTMVSWACGTSGGWNGENPGDLAQGECVTAPGATFAQPVTVNLYNVNSDNTPGSLIGSVTDTVDLLYRPSADDTDCTGAQAGEWYDAATASCHNGIATDAVLDTGNITVPDKVIYGVEIRTSDYGDPAIGGPLGDDTACHATSQGCPYDSLNLGLTTSDTEPTVGSDPLPGTVYQNSDYAGFYCDDGTTGTFRPDFPLDEASNPTDPQESCWSDSDSQTSINGGNDSYGAAPYFVPAVQFDSTCSSVCYVSPTGNDGNDGTQASPFATIQQAVDTVQSGGTVDVAAGTYDQNVVIDRPLTLQGANAGIPGWATRGPESVISTDNTSGNDLTVDVNSPGVTVEGFTIQQTATVTCNTCAAFGVQIEPVATGATVSDDIVQGMTTTGVNNPLTEAGNPIGVDVSANAGAAPDDVVVTQNLITTITSTGAQHKSAQGIQVGDSTTHPTSTGLQITGNVITSVNSASWGGYGIILNRPTAGSLIAGNTIDAVYGGGWGRGIGLEGAEASPIIADNLINGIAAPDPQSGTVADLWVDPADASGAASTAIVDNELAGATSAGVINESGVQVGATSNYWGCAAGSGAPGCSVNSSQVTSAPWIVSSTPDPTKSGLPGFWPTAIVSSVGPAITSGTSALFHEGVSGSFAVTTTGTPPVTVSESGALPPGVAFDPATDLLSGTPTHTGTYAISFTAAGGTYPTVTQDFTLVVSSNTATITSPSSYAFGASKKATINVTTGGTPKGAVSVSGLPAWLHFTAGRGRKLGTGKLSGTTPAVGGVYTVTVHANNGYGPDTTQLVTINVLGISSPASASFSKSGLPTQSFTITTTGATGPVHITVSLGVREAGLTATDLGNGTATITGTPGPGDRTALVQVTATSGSVTTIQRLAVGITG